MGRKNKGESSMWNRLKGAQRPGSGNYFNPGKYRVRLNRVKKGVNRTGDDYIAIECTIVEVLVKMDGCKMKTAEGKRTTDSNKKGSDVSQVIVFKADYYDMYLSNYMSFVCALLDLDESDIEEIPSKEWAKTMKGIVKGDGSEYAGTELIVNCVPTLTKSKTHFPKCTWFVAAGNSETTKKAKKKGKKGKTEPEPTPEPPKKAKKKGKKSKSEPEPEPPKKAKKGKKGKKKGKK